MKRILFLENFDGTKKKKKKLIKDYLQVSSTHVRTIIWRKDMTWYVLGSLPTTNYITKKLNLIKEATLRVKAKCCLWLQVIAKVQYNPRSTAGKGIKGVDKEAIHFFRASIIFTKVDAYHYDISASWKRISEIVTCILIYATINLMYI